MKRLQISFIFCIVSLLLPQANASLLSIMSVVSIHRARVKDFYERREQEAKEKLGRQKFAGELAVLRAQEEKRREVERREFLRTRQLKSSYEIERRDRLYEEYLERLTKDRDKLRIGYLRYRAMVDEAISRERKINEDQEYDLEGRDNNRVPKNTKSSPTGSENADVK